MIEKSGNGSKDLFVLRSNKQYEWKVPTKGMCDDVPKNLVIRSFISPAALLVNVSASIDRGLA